MDEPPDPGRDGRLEEPLAALNVDRVDLLPAPLPEIPGAVDERVEAGQRLGVDGLAEPKGNVADAGVGDGRRPMPTTSQPSARSRTAILPPR